MAIATILLLSSCWVASAQDQSPAPVTGIDAAFDGSAIILTWELSIDDTVATDGAIDSLSETPSGVNGYNILFGSSINDLELIATVPAGTRSYRVELQLLCGRGFTFRIDTFDDEIVTPSDFVVTVEVLISSRLAHADIDGNPVYILVPDGATPPRPRLRRFPCPGVRVRLYAI